MEEGLSAIGERAGEEIVVEKVENLERRLKAALHSEEYYEAHQVCRMLCSRLVGAQNEDKLLSLLKSTASTLRQAKELECAADLDALNCQMSDVTVTLRDGRNHTLDDVFVRGSSLRFVTLPDMLKNAPMFKNIGRAQKGAHGMGLGGIQPTPGPRGRGSAFRGGVRGRGGAVRARGVEIIVIITNFYREETLCPCKVLQNKLSGKSRVLMRRDQTLKLCANFPIYSAMALKQKDHYPAVYTWVCKDFSDDDCKEGSDEVFSARFKSADIAKEFYNQMMEAIKSTEEAA